MFYKDHALLSAEKFDCNLEDTLKLHKIIDSSKMYFPNALHRMFSHNTWFVSVLVEIIGDTIPNTKTGGELSVRDVLFEHIKEDHNNKIPSLENWIENIEIKVKPENERWFNRINLKELNKIKMLKKSTK